MDSRSGQGQADRPADAAGASRYHDYPLVLIKPHGYPLLINPVFQGE
jgi:hypothetical protein